MSATILIVEDNADTRSAYADYLRWCGYLIREAENGRDALASIEANEPDLVLLDLALPIVDGWEVARRLRAHPRHARLPIVVVTAHSLFGDERRIRQSGCDAFLTKPCDPDRLVATIAGLLTGTAGVPGR